MLPLVEPELLLSVSMLPSLCSSAERQNKTRIREKKPWMENAENVNNVCRRKFTHKGSFVTIRVQPHQLNWKGRIYWNAKTVYESVKQDLKLHIIYGDNGFDQFLLSIEWQDWFVIWMNYFNILVRCPWLKLNKTPTVFRHSTQIPQLEVTDKIDNLWI